MRRLWLFPLALLCACHRPPPPAATPDDAYRRYVAAVAAAHQGGDGAGLLDFFDAPTRKALQARAQAAAKATGSTEADPGDQLLAGGAAAAPLTDVTVKALGPDTATLQVATDGGAPAPVKMVLEGGRWRIHLDALPGS